VFVSPRICASAKLSVLIERNNGICRFTTTELAVRYDVNNILMINLIQKCSDSGLFLIEYANLYDVAVTVTYTAALRRDTI